MQDIGSEIWRGSGRVESQ